MKPKLEFNTIIKTDTILFFDLDGTLIDTDYANFLSYKKAIRSVTNNGLELSYNPQNRFNRSYLKIALPNLTQIDYERIIQKKEEYYVDFLTETKLNEDIAEILLKYSKTNQCFLVTNCRKDRALKTLDYFRLTEKFTKIYCREFDDNDKKINKFQKTLSILGVPPNIVIVFENEGTEISEAIEAGIPAQNIIRIKPASITK